MAEIYETKFNILDTKVFEEMGFSKADFALQQQVACSMHDSSIISINVEFIRMQLNVNNQCYIGLIQRILEPPRTVSGRRTEILG